MNRWTVRLKIRGPSSSTLSPAVLRLITFEVRHLTLRFRAGPDNGTYLLDVRVVEADADQAVAYVQERVGFALREADGWRSTVVAVFAEVSGE